MRETPFAVQADRVAFRYSENTGWILRDFNCAISSGEILAVLGPNGRGKTTLLKLLLDVLKPVEGEIRRAGRLGYVPQVSLPAFDYKVLEMVVMGRTAEIGLFSAPGKKDYRCAEEALERLGLADLTQRRYTRLSGGQRQLVLIARALVSKPCCLVLDEPMSALDFKNQDMILSTLKQLATEGLGVIMTTHAPQHAIHIADKILVLERGTHTLYGTPDEVMTDKRLHQLYGLELKNLSFEHSERSIRTVVPVFS